MRTIDLLREPSARHQGELAWRFGLLFGAANLLLLGIGLSAANPRRASNWNLLFALLAFVVYYNLDQPEQAWVAAASSASAPALLLLHGGAFVLALALLWWRDHGTAWRPLAAPAAAPALRMRTVRRLLYRDIVGVGGLRRARLPVAVLLHRLRRRTRRRRHATATASQHALLSALLELPGHFYELFPIAVLIGTIYALARMAQSSEFTILRTGGLGPGRALGLLACWAWPSAPLTFVVGDYVAPRSEREAVLLKARFAAAGSSAGTGAWLKERAQHARRRAQLSVNVAAHRRRRRARGRAHLRVRRRRPPAWRASRRATGRVDGDGNWTLDDASSARWPAAGRPRHGAAVRVREAARWPGRARSTPRVVAAAVLPVSTMSTVELWRYSATSATRSRPRSGTRSSSGRRRSTRSPAW